MNTSLYIAKADGDREFMDDVTTETACDAFGKMDWDRELSAVRSAEEAGGEVYIPEFGLTDESERTLVITPLDSSTVSFYILSQSDPVGVEKLPKTEVANLISRFFSGDDEAIAATVARHTPAKEISLRELSREEFQATIAEPMHRLSEKESLRQIQVRDYVGECLTRCSLPASLETVELADIYLAADKRHSHILFNYGDEATALVIVIHRDAENGDSLIGHHFAGFAESYYRP